MMSFKKKTGQTYTCLKVAQYCWEYEDSAQSSLRSKVQGVSESFWEAKWELLGSEVKRSWEVKWREAGKSREVVDQLLYYPAEIAACGLREREA